MNNGAENQEYSLLYISVALVTLLATILFTMFGKGVFSFIPILAGIVIGYVYALLVGVVNFQGVLDAKWFAMPDFIFPFVDYPVTINLALLTIFVPVAIVTLTEHIGHQLVLSKVVGKDYIKDPGLHRSILGDGTATIISALMGGPAKTTYGENIGVLAITRVYSVYVLGGAAVLAIGFGFIGKIAALIQSIPTPVMGGVSILLFGIIASSGLRIIVEAKLDFNKNRNLVIASVILVTGIGGFSIHMGEHFKLEGMAFAAILGIILNLVLPGREKAKEDLFEESIAVDETK